MEHGVHDRAAMCSLSRAPYIEERIEKASSLYHDSRARINAFKLDPLNFDECGITRRPRHDLTTSGCVPISWPFATLRDKKAEAETMGLQYWKAEQKAELNS